MRCCAHVGRGSRPSADLGGAEVGVVVLEEEDAVLAVAVAAGDASYRPARPPAGISSLTCPKDSSSKPKACRMLVNSWLVVALLSM